MGKLHTLRRAILRDPDKWYHKVEYRWGKSYIKKDETSIERIKKFRNVSFVGAVFDKGQWRPARYCESCTSYRSFVKSTLIKNDLVALGDTE